MKAGWHNFNRIPLTHRQFSILDRWTTVQKTSREKKKNFSLKNVASTNHFLKFSVSPERRLDTFHTITAAAEKVRRSSRFMRPSVRQTQDCGVSGCSWVPSGGRDGRMAADIILWWTLSSCNCRGNAACVLESDVCETLKAEATAINQCVL